MGRAAKVRTWAGNRIVAASPPVVPLTPRVAKLRGVGPRYFQPPGIRAKANVEACSHNKPVKLVILGTIVALTTWTVSANPHSDEGDKRLLA